MIMAAVRKRSCVSERGANESNQNAVTARKSNSDCRRQQKPMLQAPAGCSVDRASPWRTEVAGSIPGQGT